MLGNWSFGDYFKKEAISMAWELLTEVYKLPKDRLYVTYYGGDADKGLEPDNEARDYWLAEGLDASRILPFGNKENFWEMGDQGPCGPCSEIHFDRIGGRDASHLVNLDDPDVLEIWNLVFMQFNREADGSLRPLPNKHIDTGMGLERLVSILQNKSSNYDTDVFVPIFEAIQKLTGARPYTGKVGAEDVDGVDMAYRVVADHVRTLLIAISDSGVPSNEGRGYVLRRILRRGCRYARRKFQVQIGSFFSSLLPTVVSILGEAYPEITKKLDDVKEILDDEEVSFNRTLDRGERLFEQCLSNAKANNVNEISGQDAWRLYDTFGFPLDLTTLMAEEAGFNVNMDEFNKQQEAAKELSRKGRSGTGAQGENLVLSVHDIALVEKDESIPKTDDVYKFTESSIDATVKGIFFDNKLHSSAESSDSLIGVLLDKTNFYAESGGQEYDTGSIFIDGKVEFAVENVQVYAGYVLHTGSLKYGTLSVGDQVVASYDESRRAPLRSNHTATHVLNYALREVMPGEVVDQKGSLVAPEKLRFDFTSKGALTAEQLSGAQKICNDVVKQDLPVYYKDVSLTVAKSINGLRAVFGEVYPDPVRVVSIGADIDAMIAEPSNTEWSKYSVEFCGGTHVPRTSEIGSILLIEESAVSKGIRRIIAVTGKEAKQAQKLADEFKVKLDTLNSLKGAELDATLKTIVKELDALTISAVDKTEFRAIFADNKKRFDDEDKANKAAQVKVALEQTKCALERNPDQHFIVEVLEVGSNSKAIQGAVKHVQSLKDKAALFISPDRDNGRVSYQCVVPKTLTAQGIKAIDWVTVVSDLVGGKKGGKDESAQGAGTEVEKVSEAAKLAEEFITEKLSKLSL
jgi:alanyl-tRNA synthetase